MKERNMDNGVQEENFSSQNVNFALTRIKQTASGYEYILSSGASFFVLYSEQGTLPYAVEQLLNEDDVEVLQSADERFRAFQQSLKYISFRGHSCFELRVKLQKKGYSLPAVSFAEEELLKRGCLNDQAFAEQFVYSRMQKKKYSRNALLGQLVQRGVNRSICAEVLAESYTEEDSEEALRNEFSKISKARKGNREKIIVSLMRKGFRYGDIIAYIECNYVED